MFILGLKGLKNSIGDTLAIGSDVFETAVIGSSRYAPLSTVFAGSWNKLKIRGMSGN